MSLQTILDGWSVPSFRKEQIIRKYSVTADILSFKRCKRQYGFFGVRGFSSATATQRYFGTLVHDVLDQIQRDFIKGTTLPDQDAITELVENAHDRLLLSGVRPYNAKKQKEYASQLIYRFTALIGPSFFPHVTETEYHLERALYSGTPDEFILHGVVDVLSGAASHDLGMPFSTSNNDTEVWDYKSGSRPEVRELESYEYQMRVYAELYRQQTGNYPARCVLVFLGELSEQKRWNNGNCSHNDFPDLFHIITPTPTDIQNAINDFRATVEDIKIEKEKPYDQQWEAPSTFDKQTCDACELRFNCPTYPNSSRQREEPL